MQLVLGNAKEYIPTSRGSPKKSFDYWFCFDFYNNVSSKAMIIACSTVMIHITLDKSAAETSS